MTMRNLEATVRHKNGAAVIDLAGEIDALAEGALNDAYSEAAGGRPTVVILNFGGVDYINSTGIALIVNVLA